MSPNIQKNSPETVWLAGASGLVGSFTLDALLDDSHWSTVVSLGRRTLDRAHPKLDQRTVRFDSLETRDFPTPTVAVCALGTTMKTAGSESAFRAVDHDAVLSFARAALTAGARRLVVVTAHGAAAESMVFYNRVKAETERDLQNLGFASLAIVRPSLLLGDRSDPRPLERATIQLSRLFQPLLKHFDTRPIEARTVGRALAHLARTPTEGTKIYPNAEIFLIGE